MARPRLISDETILETAYELIMALGPSKLTFVRLAGEVGLVPAALVKRFKNKRQLLLEVDRYALNRTNEKVDNAMEKETSPIEAILAQFITELGFASSLERFANGQEFLLMDFREKKLYSNYRLSFEHRHEQIVELLKHAADLGELQGVEDEDELARHLEMIVHGAGHVWAMTQDAAIEEYISTHVTRALKPYKNK